MKPEDKVASLEQCKKLVELGVVLDTENCWYSEDGFVEFALNVLELCENQLDLNTEYYPAPDVAELGVLLPMWYDTEYKSPCVDFYKIPTGIGGRIEFSTNKTDKIIYDRTEAEARCAALIWLLENGYIKPSEVKL